MQNEALNKLLSDWSKSLLSEVDTVERTYEYDYAGGSDAYLKANAVADKIITASNQLASALRTALPTVPAAAPVAQSGWVSCAGPLPEPIDTPNGPAPYSADVLLWAHANRAAAVGYYDYRLGYECFQVYDMDDYPTPAYWQPITPPTPC